MYYSQGKYKQAIEQFQRILSIDPDNISANYLLGTACLETQQRPKAMQLFKEVLRLQPDNDEALNSLAYMYAEDEVNLDEGLRMARKAVDLDPSNGAYFDTLGWLLFKKGMNSEALLSFQKAEMYVHDSVVYEHMGDVYYAIKEFVLARKYWRKSLDLQPHQPQVKAKLEELEKLQAFRKPD